MQITNFALEKGLSLAYAQWATVRRYPKSRKAILRSKLYNSFWYYDAELIPDVITKGQYPQTTPLLPRMLLRNCDLNGADCLDIGSMEGLIPVLMCRQGASRVLATDFMLHCYLKMRALMHYYDVDFSFKQIGHLYELSNKIASRQWPGFDLINLSGVLYHVFSPFHVLAGVRPLLKKNGLIIVSTNVVDHDGFAMEFNNSGRFQSESNTFWYLTIPMLDYMLRYFQLAPIDCLYHRYPPQDTVRWVKDSSAGYLSVVCRAVDDKGASFGDRWLNASVSESWEYFLCDQKMIDGQSRSKIGYRNGDETIDIQERLSQTKPVEAAHFLHDTNSLRLADKI
ncbi:class I SAM-dependent methyltransferase [Mycobacterium sp. M23085]|uniref:class I SAM-dependent methyltransferase n=1 Tax=Mycobacterium sp. M23085 TaxID=3378087 RepID=UPI003877EB37